MQEKLFTRVYSIYSTIYVVRDTDLSFTQVPILILSQIYPVYTFLFILELLPSPRPFLRFTPNAFIPSKRRANGHSKISPRAAADRHWKDERLVQIAGEKRTTKRNRDREIIFKGVKFAKKRNNP